MGTGGVDWMVAGDGQIEEAAKARGVGTHRGEGGERLRVVPSHRLVGRGSYELRRVAAFTVRAAASSEVQQTVKFCGPVTRIECEAGRLYAWLYRRVRRAAGTCTAHRITSHARAELRICAQAGVAAPASLRSTIPLDPRGEWSTIFHVLGPQRVLHLKVWNSNS